MQTQNNVQTHLDSSYDKMKLYPQFILCKLTKKQTSDKYDKLPWDYVNNRLGSIHNNNLWMDYCKAIAVCDRLNSNTNGEEHTRYHIGFVLLESDPFFILDIDGNMYGDLVDELTNTLVGACVEKSISGNGLHIIGTGNIPPHSCRNIKHSIELYTDNRFVLISGYALFGDCATDCTATIAPLVTKYFPREDSTETPDEPGYELEDCVVKVDTGRLAVWISHDPKLKALWEGNGKELSADYPSSSGDEYDRSSADIALAQKLAFWIKPLSGDAPLYASLCLWMRASGLVRDKWDVKGYLARTVKNGMGWSRSKSVNKREVESPIKPKRSSKVSGVLSEATIARWPWVTGCEVKSSEKGEYVYADEKMCRKIFDGWYLSAIGVGVSGAKAIDPTGKIISERLMRAAFPRIMYWCEGKYSKTSEPYLSLECLGKEIVTGRISNPKEPTASVSDGEFNVYKKPCHPESGGSPEIFLEHVYKLLPDFRDAGILLGYLSALVKYPWLKLGWSIVLQGVEGNGKSMFVSILNKLLGKENVCNPTQSMMTSRFNGWLDCKNLVICEEINIMDRKVSEVNDLFKRLVGGGNDMAFEYKGQEGRIGRSSSNFLFVTNHKNGIRKLKYDRRFCHLFTAQQSESDLIRDGMDYKYFDALRENIDDPVHVGAIFRMLSEYAGRAELDPAGACKRAPQSSCHKEVLEESRSNVERIIQGEIDAGTHGFRDGIISMFHLSNLVVEVTKSRFTPKKLIEIMENLGFIRHPHLRDGRLNSSIGNEGKRIIFVKEGSEAAQISDQNAIRMFYAKSLGLSVAPGNNYQHYSNKYKQQ